VLPRPFYTDPLWIARRASARIVRGCVARLSPFLTEASCCLVAHTGQSLCVSGGARLVARAAVSYLKLIQTLWRAYPAGGIFSTFPGGNRQPSSCRPVHHGFTRGRQTATAEMRDRRAGGIGPPHAHTIRVFHYTWDCPKPSCWTPPNGVTCGERVPPHGPRPARQTVTVSPVNASRIIIYDDY